MSKLAKKSEVMKENTPGPGVSFVVILGLWRGKTPKKDIQYQKLLTTIIGLDHIEGLLIFMLLF
jgi:hypothetical protein